jgi:hypothetical protein
LGARTLRARCCSTRLRSRVNRRRCARRSRRGQNRVCRIALSSQVPARADAHSRARLRGQLKAPLVREIMAERSSPTPIAALTVFTRTAAGPKIPAHSLAACVARRRSCGQWASTLPSAGKAGPEAGSLGYVQLRKISAVRSAVSATSLHRDRPVTFATTTLAQI